MDPPTRCEFLENVWLQWHGPFLFDDLTGYENEGLSADAGVYTLLDSEELEHGWGNYELFYVRMVYGRTFRVIVPEHAVQRGDDAWRWIQHNLEGELTAKVATVTPQEGKNITESLVRDIENLLLFRLDPPVRTCLKHGISYISQILRSRCPMFFLLRLNSHMPSVPLQRGHAISSTVTGSVVSNYSVTGICLTSSLPSHGY